MKGGGSLGAFLSPIIEGVGTFADALVSNATLLSVVGVIISCGIAAFAFGVVKRFIKR